MNNKDSEILMSGKTSFKIEVPYKLYESGGSDLQKKPLIVYLHGFRQNVEVFQRLVDPMLELTAYHLFIQGPYPVYETTGRRKVDEWGRAWYLYDGEQDQFTKSLELTSEFIQDVLDGLLNHIEVSRICILGYSMGAYQAGYFTLSRWKHVNELIMIGGRLKTELFSGREHHYDHLNVLGLHGSKDDSVKAGPQKDSLRQFEEWGGKATYMELEEGHRLKRSYIHSAIEWLASLEYK